MNFRKGRYDGPPFGDEHDLSRLTGDQRAKADQIIHKTNGGQPLSSSEVKSLIELRAASKTERSPYDRIFADLRRLKAVLDG